MNLSNKPEIVVESISKRWLKETHYLRSEGTIFPGLHPLDLDSDDEKARKFNAVYCKIFDDGNKCLYDGEDRQSWADNFRKNILRNFIMGNDVWYISHTNFRQPGKPSQTLTYREMQSVFPRASFNFHGRNIHRLFFEFRKNDMEELFQEYWNGVCLPNPIYGMLINSDYETKLLKQSSYDGFDFNRIKLMFNTWPEENKFFTFFSFREDFESTIRMMNPMTLRFS
jgi:hypothetical protein